MIPQETNQVVRMNPETGEMRGYDIWADGYSPSVRYGQFSGGVYDGENLWLIPAIADNVLKINTRTGSLTRFRNWPDDFNRGNAPFFKGGVYDGRYIWMVPSSANQIVRLDPLDGSMQGYSDWPEGFQLEPYAFSGAVYHEGSIWFIPSRANQVIKMDTETEELTGYHDWPSGYVNRSYAFNGGVFDGENIWMIPYGANQVVKMNAETGIMTGYDWSLSHMNQAAFDGQNIWSRLAGSNEMIKIDTATSEIEVFQVSNEYSGSYLSTFDGLNVWMIATYKPSSQPPDAVRISSVPIMNPAIVEEGQVKLSWQPVNGAVEYTISQSLTPSSSGTAIATVTGAEHVYTVTNQPEEVPYYYTVRAIFAGRESRPSNEVEAIVLSDNVNLSGLTLSAGELSPTFSEDTTSYTVNVSNETSSIVLTPTVMDARSEITINGEPATSGSPFGPVALELGSNSIEVEVIAQSGAAKKYMVDVIRQFPDQRVEFHLNGGTMEQASVIDVPYGSRISEPAPLPQLAGYVFAGWYTDESWLQQAEFPLTVEQDIALYAKWDPLPTVLLNSTAGDPLNGPFTVTASFSKAVTGFTLDDVLVSNGTGSNFNVVSEMTYTFVVTPSTDGQVTVEIPAGVAQDAAGNENVASEPLVRTYDGTAPVIALNGADPLVIAVNADYEEPGATAQDALDGDVTAAISITGNIDTATVGSYERHYVVTDRAGNQAETRRTVHVIDPPLLNLEGPAEISIKQGSTFRDPGAAATDAYYGDLSDQIMVSGTVDTGRAGVYTLRYTVANPIGQTAEAIRKVTVTRAVFYPSNFLSDNTRLKTLEVHAGGQRVSLTPSFTPDQFTYMAETEAKQVEVQASAEHAAAQVTWQDQPLNDGIRVELREGENILDLIVQAQDGTRKTYTLKINRTIPAKPIDPEAPVEPKTPIVEFTDIAGHWAEKDIRLAAGKGIVSGYPAGAFKPNNAVTRAEFTVMLAGVLNLGDKILTLTFTDEDQIAEWSRAAVAQTVQAGIIIGYEDGSFRPSSKITRAEMAVMIARALKLQFDPGVSTPFIDDEAIPGWSVGAVEAIRQLGIVGGRGGNRFEPGETATRAEATVMLLRMLEHN
ncbi:immunoglobulin-like domain-containing protein [Paenibacillus sp. GCM10012307]